MSQELRLSAQIRTKFGKNANRQLRANGILPAVYYNTQGESIALQVSETALNRLYTVIGRTTLFNLEIDNNGSKVDVPCLVWDAEYYPTQQRFQHVDFYGVDLDKEIKIRVPLEFAGTSKGVKAGGKMETYRDHVDVWSKPATLPSKIIIDITNMDIGDAMRANDIVTPEGVRIHQDDNFAVLSILVAGKGSDAQDEDGEGEEAAE